MPTTWTHARALATLEKAGWAETQRQGTDPAAFDRHDEAVRRVHGVLAEAGDAWATARRAPWGSWARGASSRGRFTGCWRTCRWTS
ncbi:hypothetical protein DIPPA_02103 [Diplonema papillatum]|nr:hypothetical protein DIPPA_02103 [Diplonema papillatum]